MDRGTRNYKDRSALLAIAGDIFSQARIYHLSHDSIMELTRTRLYDDYRWKRAPRYIQSAVLAAHETHMSYLYRYDLQWRVLLDGQYMSGDQVPHNRWADVVPEGGHFFYNGTDKVF